MTRFLLLALLFAILTPLQAMAQMEPTTMANGAPAMPKPLAEQHAAGAQVFYLGRFETLDGWVMVRQSQPEFYYATTDGKAVVMGFLFDGEGKLLTGDQLKKIDKSKQASLTELMTPQAGATVAPATPMQTPAQTATTQTEAAPAAQAAAPQKQPAGPAAMLLNDMIKAAGITYGLPDRPMFYAFIDPNCAHCQQFLRDVEPQVMMGTVSVRMIPVGFNEKSMQQAAIALASADGGQRFVNYAKGDAKALPDSGGADATSVIANVKIMDSWDLTSTPIILYQAASNGEIKIIRGRPKNLGAAINDLTGGR